MYIVHLDLIMMATTKPDFIYFQFYIISNPNVSFLLRKYILYRSACSARVFESFTRRYVQNIVCSLFQSNSVINKYVIYQMFVKLKKRQFDFSLLIIFTAVPESWLGAINVYKFPLDNFDLYKTLQLLFNRVRCQQNLENAGLHDYQSFCDHSRNRLLARRPKGRGGNYFQLFPYL